jgi:nucleotide-binding universal stress UspA family protein
MIRCILVALDPDSDTRTAVRYASELARRHSASVTGLAVVDTGHIEASIRGGGIGSMYYAEKLREQLTEEARLVARRLIEEFDAIANEEGLRHHNTVAEGVPFQRIVEDMKYHDLLVVGKEPHFFYSHPEEKNKTLVRIVHESIGPVLVVSEAYRAIHRVLMAYDGSAAAARTIQRFAQLQPFGTDVAVDLLTISEETSEAQLMLSLMGAYLQEHGFTFQATVRSGENVAEEIVRFAEEIQADLVVAGAYATSGLKRWFFGSSTSALLEKTTLPLFVYH